MNKRLFLAVWLCALILVVQRLPITKIVEQDIVAITESTFELISGFEGKRHKAYKANGTMDASRGPNRPASRRSI